MANYFQIFNIMSVVPGPPIIFFGSLALAMAKKHFPQKQIKEKQSNKLQNKNKKPYCITLTTPWRQRKRHCCLSQKMRRNGTPHPSRCHPRRQWELPPAECVMVAASRGRTLPLLPLPLVLAVLGQQLLNILQHTAFPAPSSPCWAILGQTGQPIVVGPIGGVLLFLLLFLNCGCQHGHHGTGHGREGGGTPALGGASGSGRTGWEWAVNVGGWTRMMESRHLKSKSGEQSMGKSANYGEIIH